MGTAQHQTLKVPRVQKNQIQLARKVNQAKVIARNPRALCQNKATQ